LSVVIVAFVHFQAPTSGGYANALLSGIDESRTSRAPGRTMVTSRSSVRAEDFADNDDGFHAIVPGGVMVRGLTSLGNG
jgi:hypothetical protein